MNASLKTNGADTKQRRNKCHIVKNISLEIVGQF